MGCDIHLFCERRVDYDKWECEDHFRIKTDDAPETINIQSINDYPKYLDPVPLYSDRSYALFSLLAGVRGSGGIEQIDDRRGLPHDVSEIVKAYSDYWDVDGHSHSWYTAKELFKKKYEMEEERRWLNDDEELDDEEFEWAYRGLCKLCQAITIRMVDVFYIYDSSEAVIEERVKKNADKFRVIFWFDC